MKKTFLFSIILFALVFTIVEKASAQSREVKVPPYTVVTTQNSTDKVLLVDPTTRILKEITLAEFTALLAVPTSVTTQLNLKANIASPTFTGTVIVPKIKLNSVGATIDSAKVSADTLRFWVGGVQYKAAK